MQKFILCVSFFFFLISNVFAQTQHFSPIGSAKPLLADSSSCIELTNGKTTGQTGCAWEANNTFDFSKDYSYDFHVNLGSNPNGADGMSFVIHNDPAGRNACGGTGGGLGAANIQKSIIFEIDTYWNTEDRDDKIAGSACSGGASADHLDIWLNGNINQSNNTCCPCNATCGAVPPCTDYRVNTAGAVPLKNGAAFYNIKNKKWHIMRVSWSVASSTLSITILSEDLGTTYGTIGYILTNPIAYFGTNNPYFGFTASTGGLTNRHMFCLPLEFSLPIHLLTFQLEKVAISKLMLSWLCPAKVLEKQYVLEKSSDLNRWREIYSVENDQKSNSSKAYQFIDQELLTKSTYYRLKGLDEQGKFSFSKTIAYTPKTASEFTFSPNPADHQLQFQISPELFSYKSEIRLLDMQGKTIASKLTNISTTPEELIFNTENLPEGLYLLKFTSDLLVTNRLVHIKH